jgi:hypothetical protein
VKPLESPDYGGPASPSAGVRTLIVGVLGARPLLPILREAPKLV